MEEDEEFIGTDGIQELCKACGISADGLEIMYFCCKINVSKMNCFYKGEFIRGLEKLRCDTIPKLKQYLKSLTNELQNNTNFKHCYEFAFEFAKGDKDKKSLEKEYAAVLVTVLLGDRFPMAHQFSAFLESSACTVKGINRDQWMCLLEFCKTTKEDLSNYEDCWPLLLDEFVDWTKQQRKK